MRLMPIIIAALYDHFYKMKEKGRKVVPWSQTAFVCALSATFLVFMLGKIILTAGKSTLFQNAGEPMFVVFFLGVGAGFFFLIKSFYFDTEKFIGYYKDFMQLPAKKRMLYKIVVIGSIIALPPLLVWKIWYDAK